MSSKNPLRYWWRRSQKQLWRIEIESKYANCFSRNFKTQLGKNFPVHSHREGRGEGRLWPFVSFLILKLHATNLLILSKVYFKTIWYNPIVGYLKLQWQPHFGSNTCIIFFNLTNNNKFFHWRLHFFRLFLFLRHFCAFWKNWEVKDGGSKMVTVWEHDTMHQLT